MNQGLIPRRYAKALYKFALERGVDRQVYTLMGNIVKAFEENPGLGEALSNPFVSDTDKLRLLTLAANADAKTSGVFADFLKLLQQNKRLEMAREMAIAYREIYRQVNNIRRVKVTSAMPMGAAEETRLKQLITDHLKGATMEYSTEVNPDLIGGFTVAIDNERLDASVANALKEMGQTLITK